MHQINSMVGNLNPFSMVKSLLNIQKNLRAQVDKGKSAQFSAEFQNISGKIGLVDRLRNNLPELRRMKSVYWDETNNWWVVDAADSPPIFTEQLPLRIGGCPRLHSQFKEFGLPSR